MTDTRRDTIYTLCIDQMKQRLVLQYSPTEPNYLL